MNLIDLITDPLFSSTLSICTPVLQVIIKNIEEVKSPIKFSILIDKSVKETITCVGSFNNHPYIKKDLVAKFTTVLSAPTPNTPFKSELLQELNNVLKEYDLQFLPYQEEFVNFFMLYFISELQKDDNLWRKVEYTLNCAIYNEVTNIDYAVNNSVQKLLNAISEFRHSLDINMHSSINHTHYINQILATTSKWNLVNNIEISDFNEIFSYINDEIHFTWKDRCLNIINIPNLKSPTKTKVRNMSSCLFDDTSCEQVRSTLYDICDLLDKDCASDLKQLADSHFNKCFIVSGEPGAGKTEFIYRLILYFEEMPNTYVIPIMHTTINSCSSIEILQTSIVQTINYYLATNFSNLVDISTFCKSIQKDTKIIIVIDDLHNINTECLNYIFQIMVSSSGMSSLFWIFTINEYWMYIFDKLKISDFQRYTLLINTNNLCNFNLFHYDFNLSKYNHHTRVGYTILAEYKCENVRILSSGCQTICTKSINNPLIAHFIGKQKGDVGNLELKSFYIDFAKSIIKYLTDALIDILNPKVNNPNEHLRMINNLCAFIRDKHTIYISQDEFICLADANLEYALKKVGLLIFSDTSANTDYLDENYGIVTTNYEFFFDLYWASKIVATSHITEYIHYPDRFYNLFFELIEITQYCEEICEYVTYIMDKNVKDNNWCKWLSILSGIKKLYVLFIYLNRLEQSSVEHIVATLINHTYKLNIKDVYTLVYAIRNISLAVENKYRLIAAYANEFEIYSKTNQTSSFPNFVYTFKIITKENNTCDQLLENINYFFPLNTPKLNKIMGSICAEHFFNLSNKNLNQSIKLIEELIGNNNRIFIDLNKQRRQHKVFKSFFDEFLKEFFYLSIESHGVKFVFTVLNQKHLFDKKGWHGNLYRYNFTNAAGDHFSKYKKKFLSPNAQKFRSEYIGIVRSLVITCRSHKLIFAFHFISNSLENYNNNDEELDPALVDILRNMRDSNLLDPQKYGEFFNRIPN